MEGPTQHLLCSALLGIQLFYFEVPLSRVSNEENPINNCLEEAERPNNYEGVIPAQIQSRGEETSQYCSDNITKAPTRAPNSDQSPSFLFPVPIREYGNYRRPAGRLEETVQSESKTKESDCSNL